MTNVQQLKFYSVIEGNYFCAANNMKKISFISLLIFTMAQVVPAVNAIAGKAVVSVFAPDEEKEKDKGNNSGEKKHKAICFTLHLLSITSSFTASLEFHHSERHYTSPIMEKLVPPPNHS